MRLCALIVWCSVRSQGENRHKTPQCNIVAKKSNTHRILNLHCLLNFLCWHFAKWKVDLIRSRNSGCGSVYVLGYVHLGSDSLGSIYSAGNNTLNVAPCPGSLSAQMYPPWFSTTLRTMERPTPVPLYSAMP